MVVFFMAWFVTNRHGSIFHGRVRYRVRTDGPVSKLGVWMFSLRRNELSSQPPILREENSQGIIRDPREGLRPSFKRETRSEPTENCMRSEKRRPSPRNHRGFSDLTIRFRILGVIINGETIGVTSGHENRVYLFPSQD